jgi:hypothetical protein
MYPVVSTEIVASSMELVCLISTTIAVFVSYLLSLRF